MEKMVCASCKKSIILANEKCPYCGGDVITKYAQFDYDENIDYNKYFKTVRKKKTVTKDFSLENKRKFVGYFIKKSALVNLAMAFVTLVFLAFLAFILLYQPIYSNEVLKNGAIYQMVLAFSTLMLIILGLFYVWPLYFYRKNIIIKSNTVEEDNINVVKNAKKRLINIFYQAYPDTINQRKLNILNLVSTSLKCLYLTSFITYLVIFVSYFGSSYKPNLFIFSYLVAQAGFLLTMLIFDLSSLLALKKMSHKSKLL